MTTTRDLAEIRAKHGAALVLQRGQKTFSQDGKEDISEYITKICLAKGQFN